MDDFAILLSRIERTTVEIPLTQGKVALVDADDLPLVADHKWFAQRSRLTWYASRTSSDGTCVFMHRLIVDAPTGIRVDHRDRDGLNNTRRNLRLATPTQNAANSIPRGRSRFKGVYWHRKDSYRAGGVWVACIKTGGRRIDRAAKTEEDAARLYNQLAREMYGEFAWLNEVTS